MSESARPRAGASIKRLSGTRAAGCASQVGYQKDRISLRAWYREPAPPSKPSNEGGFRKRVFIVLLPSPPESYRSFVVRIGAMAVGPKILVAAKAGLAGATFLLAV